MERQKFYFRSYDRVIGEASDLRELGAEIRRLSEENSKAVEYHLREGHISQWLEFVGEPALSARLRGAKSARDAEAIMENYWQSKTDATRYSTLVRAQGRPQAN
jgi:hypothetical protein